MCFQTTLLRLLEDWKSALDKNCYVAAILMDLSKAFDCLPHDILLSKLVVYGLSSQSARLLENYLTGRNLKGGMVFCFVQKFKVRIFFFFLSREERNFFPEFNIR